MIRVFTFSFTISHISSNLLQPEYSVKVLNTENIILSIGDLDDQNDDLEIIKDQTDNPEIELQLRKFHSFVKRVEATEKPKFRFLYDPQTVYKPKLDMSYPDSPYDIAVNPKHLSALERRRRKKTKWKFQKKFIYRGLNKRETYTTENIDTATEYDYMEKEYQDFLAKSQDSDTVFKYSNEGKPEENLKDVIVKIADVRPPKNCTNVTGIGVQAMECIVKNYKNKEIDQKQMFKKVGIIMLIWFCVYLAIAGPLWCTRGWCCCCFRCAFCFPTRTVKEIQKYIAENPPGLYISPEGKEERYNPSPREIEIYENLKKSIASF